MEAPGFSSQETRRKLHTAKPHTDKLCNGNGNDKGTGEFTNFIQLIIRTFHYPLLLDHPAGMQRHHLFCMDNEDREAKIGRINISILGNTVNISFTYLRRKRSDLKVTTNTEAGWIKVIQTAQLTNNNFERKKFWNYII